jgi:serine/threonine-protein kinase
MRDVLEVVRAGLAPHYTVEREIGAGGMARVYLAVERNPPRKVAVKVMMPSLNSPAFRARFTREIELTGGLQHPHIVPILAAEECLFVPDGPDDLCYYVMPYVEGESLRQRLNREKRFPLAEALKITREVAGALQFAHGRNIIHRDLKPENILLDGAHALLTDFGVARAISAAQEDPSLTTEGVVVGSLAYMSPEQMAAKGPLDARTDIYALGCVFHEMITGTAPLMAAAWTSKAERPAFRRALLDQGIGRAVVRGLEMVVCRALCPEPDQRYSSVEEFVAALEQARRPGFTDRLAALFLKTGGR